MLTIHEETTGEEGAEQDIRRVSSEDNKHQVISSTTNSGQLNQQLELNHATVQHAIVDDNYGNSKPPRKAKRNQSPRQSGYGHSLRVALRESAGQTDDTTAGTSSSEVSTPGRKRRLGDICVDEEYAENRDISELGHKVMYTQTMHRHHSQWWRW